MNTEEQTSTSTINLTTPTMERAHFILVQDSHLSSHRRTGRKNYLGESMRLFNWLRDHLREIRQQYPNPKTDKIYLISLGDFFDRDEEAFKSQWVQNVSILRANCNGFFAVIGNHEKTHFKGSPFWDCISTIEGDMAKGLGYSARGVLPIIRVPDHLDIWDYRIHLCHHGTEIYNVSVDKNILLAHNYYMTDLIFTACKNLCNDKVIKKYAHYTRIDDNSPIRWFSECFFGHYHSLMGHYSVQWDEDLLGPTNLHYMASLLPTNKSEVLDMPDYREVAHLIIHKPDASGESHHELVFDKYHLGSPSDLLKMSEVRKNEAHYKETKERKHYIAKCIENTSDTIEDVKTILQDDPLSIEIIEAAEQGKIPDYILKEM